MIILLLHLLAWIPAILGYASVLLLVRRRISSTPGAEFEITEFWFGLILLATISTFWNFFFPVTRAFAAALLVIGWILCWYRFRKLHFTRPNVRKLIFAFVWMAFVAFWCAQKPINHDAGLYHYPAIRWVDDNALPFGLANLHQRFGFNSMWFPLASILRLPFFHETAAHCFSISALLIYFFGIAVAKAFARIRSNESSITDIFLSLSVLILLGNVFRRNISSPSPDLAILLLCVFVIYLALQMIRTTSDGTYKCFQIIVLSVFGICIKLSSLPLLLLPLSLILWSFRKRIPFSVKQLAGYSLLFSGIVLVVSLARGIILSGCLVFPVQQSCFQTLSWAVPANTILSYNSLVKLTAQFPNVAPPKTASNWLGHWFSQQLFSIDFVLPFVLLAAGLVLLLRAKPVRKEVVWLVLPLIGAILFWFFTAPDMRFGSGYFWALALLILSSTTQGGDRETGVMKKIAVIFLFSVFIVSVDPLRSYLYFGLPPFRRAFRNPREFLFVLPVPKSKTETRSTLDGISIRIPVEGDDCWFSEIPCTPAFNENLKIEKSATGRYRKFYFP